MVNLFVDTVILNVGFCKIASAFIYDIEENLHQLNKKLNQSVNRRPNIGDLMETFRNTIQFHAEAIEFSDEFQN